jgi:hypothetical protein
MHHVHTVSFFLFCVGQVENTKRADMKNLIKILLYFTPAQARETHPPPLMTKFINA